MSMSNTTGDDFLNLDFDPDVLISLIGKLSLEAIPFDAIPLDVSDTLLNLEKKMESSFQNLAVSSAEYAPHLFTAGSSGYVPPEETSQAEPCPPVNVEKERFLSSIGLSPRAAFKPPPKRRTSGKELSYIFNRIEPPETAYDPVLEDPPNSPYAPVFVEDDVLGLPKEEFDAVVKGFLTNLCDKSTPLGSELSFPSLSDFQPIAESDFLPATAVSGYQPVSDFQPAIVSGFEPAAALDFQPALVTDFQPAPVLGFQPAPVLDFQPVSVSDFQPASVLDLGQAAVSDFQPASVLDLGQAAVSDFQSTSRSDFQTLNHTFNPPFHEIFQNPIRGNVIDIDLSTLDCRPKYDQTTSSLLNEVSSDSDGSFPSLGSCSQEGLCSESSQASSVDKYVSSPDSGYTSCSSVISPCSLTDTSDTQCLYEISEEDDRQIDELVAALIEVENNFNWRDSNVQSVSSVVPVLTGSGDPKDYKERILNFLKEPLSAEKPVSPPRDAGDTGSSSEPLENALEEDNTLLYFSLTKKASSKMRELKQGFEFRYASKSELRHSSLLTKLKLHSEKSKILKQIQEDEREQKRLKVIQVLDRKLKRGGTSADDIENKRRKVQCKEA